jgi:MOSC domain-containing protein
MSARLHRITIYPIKSLDGVAVDEIEVLPACGLANDRRFALQDANGRFINGKRTARSTVSVPHTTSQICVCISATPTATRRSNSP